MNETNHPARRLRHGDRPTEPLKFEDAAANKAAEEGEPTDAELAQEVLLEDLEAIANYWDGTMVETAMHGQLDVGQALRERFAKLKFPAIAADRASRQVANKAEAERQKMHGNGDDGWYFDCDGHYIDVVRDENGKYSIYFRNRSPESEAWLDQADTATHPANTGASTAPRPTDDELWDATIRDRDAYHEWADNLAYAIAVHFGVDIGEHSNQNLPWAEALEVIENAERVGASTVLTDERILKIARECAIDEVTDERRPDMATIIDFAREVAAQAGQVAVPGWISVDDRLPELQKEVLICCGYLVLGYRTDDKHDPENHNGWVIDFDNGMASPITHWMPLPAAPSPAKESK